MAKGLKGKRIVIAASRKTDEMSTLIEKQGGIPVVRSLQGTVFPALGEMDPDLQKFVQEGADWVIFTTGIGIEALLKESDKLGFQTSFLSVIKNARVASRGYKTLSTLRKLGIAPAATDSDGTSRSLINNLDSFEFEGKRVMVQLHGETAPTLMHFLHEKGASVTQLLPYQHTPPEAKIVETLCIELAEGLVDAVCFTSAIQIRSLFDYAKHHGYLGKVKQAFEKTTLAVAVGKVTGEALLEEGIERVVAPNHERMGAMIIELSRFYKDHDNF